MKPETSSGAHAIRGGAMRCMLLVGSLREVAFPELEPVLEEMIDAGTLLMAESLLPAPLGLVVPAGMPPAGALIGMVLLEVRSREEAAGWAARLVRRAPWISVEVRPVREGFSREFDPERIRAVA
jgi:hypothetical protein